MKTRSIPVKNTLPQVYDTSKRTFVDLGLPSGTLWLKEPDNAYYNWNEAVEKFGRNLPTNEQFIELIKECLWRWDESENAWMVSGPNQQTIKIGAKGYKNPYGELSCFPYVCEYWSSTETDQESAWVFTAHSFNKERGIRPGVMKRLTCCPILLVKQP